MENYIVKEEFDFNELNEYLKDYEYNDKKLVESIKNSKIILYNLVFTDDIIKMVEKDDVRTALLDPTKEIYRDYIFTDYRILIIILYLGGYKDNDGKIKDENITEDIFINNTGKVLDQKGFRYEISYS